MSLKEHIEELAEQTAQEENEAAKVRARARRKMRDDRVRELTGIDDVTFLRELDVTRVRATSFGDARTYIEKVDWYAVEDLDVLLVGPTASDAKVRLVSTCPTCNASHDAGHFAAAYSAELDTKGRFIKGAATFYARNQHTRQCRLCEQDRPLQCTACFRSLR